MPGGPWQPCDRAHDFVKVGSSGSGSGLGFRVQGSGFRV